LKSTTFSINSEESAQGHRFSLADKWKAFPFLILLLTSSLPLNYKLEESHPMLVSDVAELTSEATASANSGSSILFVLFLTALYLVAGCMILKKPRTVIAVLRRQWPLALLMLLITASALWSYHPEKVVLNTVHAIGMTLIAIAAVLRYRHDPWLFPKHVSYVLGVNMVLHIIAIIAIPSYAIDWQGRWQGLATHPNTLGALGFTTLWANSVVLMCMNSSRRYLHWIFAALAVLAMLGANSVTSIVTSTCSVTSLYILTKLWRLRASRKFYFSLLLIGCIAAVTVAVLATQFDLGWLFDMFGRDANFTGRTSVWEDGLAAMSQRPMLGWSFDDHAYLIESRGMPYPTYHNGWLDLGVSGGVVSIILFLLLLGTWLKDFVRSRRIGREIIPFSASFAIGYMVHNLTEASLLAPRGQMWQIFLVLLILGACSRPSGVNDRSG
jgi:O-antigen ligase